MARDMLGGLAGCVLGAWMLFSNPAAATPTIYTYNQTSSSVPGFNVVGSIAIDGGFADLPTIFNGFPGPYDFRNLIDLSLAMDGRSYSLSQFTSKNMIGFPLWSISPSHIQFVDAIDGSDYTLTFGVLNSGQIGFNTDFSFSGNCDHTGACVAQGTWVSSSAAIPEPMTVALFGVGALLLMAHGRKRNSDTIFHSRSRPGSPHVAKIAHTPLQLIAVLEVWSPRPTSWRQPECGRAG